MTTENPLGEGFDNAVRAVLRPSQPQASPSGKLRVANLFCGTGQLSQAAVEAGMEIAYAHDANISSRGRAAYERKYGFRPDDNELLNFADIPAFNILLATLPASNIEGAIDFVLRYLRVRRPDTFVLVGPNGENDQALATLVREKTQNLGYQIAAGSDILLGIYEPDAKKDAPVMVGLYLLDPIRLPVLSSDKPERRRTASTIQVVLEKITEAFGR